MAPKKKAQDPQSADAAGLAAVEQYFASLPEPVRSTLTTVRNRIRTYAPPESTEGFGYGVPAFRCEALLAGYAAGKKFCSYYPMSGRVIHDLKDDLLGYETTSGAIHFPLDKPLPAALVRKLVQARLQQIRQAK